jgi:hypothetical protein
MAEDKLLAKVLDEDGRGHQFWVRLRIIAGDYPMCDTSAPSVAA